MEEEQDRDEPLRSIPVIDSNDVPISVIKYRYWLLYFIHSLIREGIRKIFFLLLITCTYGVYKYLFSKNQFLFQRIFRQEKNNKKKQPDFVCCSKL